MTTILHVAALWLGTFLFSFALFAAIGKALGGGK